MSGAADDLRRRIQDHGPMPVDAFMAASNAAYYGRGDVFGATGDFVTAPDISQAFGELIGLWAGVTWTAIGAPYPFRLIECGPGRGILMRDALRASARVPGFLAAADIHLVETSDALRKTQEHALAEHAVAWHRSVASLPPGPAIVIANEFLDALPVRQFVRQRNGWHERMVGLNDQGALEFVVGRAVADDGPAAAVGAIIERCEEAATWTRAVAARVIRDGGAALVIDYGHKATATGDTLQAVRRHAYHSVLSAPGEADLTAHVDFEAIGAAAVAAGANVFGPIEQGLWLRRLGIQMRQAQLCAGKSEVVAREIAAGIRRLITPDGMGALFKVLAFAHPSVASLEGFAQDTIDDHR